jgi:hypothetical protein
MARFIAFAWSKVAFVGVGVSAFESTGIYTFKGNRVFEYLFSIPDVSKTEIFMKTAPPNMALFCEISTSVTKSQNSLPILAEPSLNILSTILPSDTALKKLILPDF